MNKPRLEDFIFLIEHFANEEIKFMEEEEFEKANESAELQFKARQEMKQYYPDVVVI